MKVFHETQVPWPVTKKRRAVRKRGPFSVNLATAADRVEKEISLFTRNVGEVWIYANGKKGAYHAFLANQTVTNSPEVVVQFDLDGKEFLIAADAFDDPAQNLAGIAEEIKSMRARVRNGVQTLDEILSTFSALPAPPRPTVDWREVLGNHDELVTAERAYKARSLKAHPDQGGTDEAMARLNEAIRQAREELK